MRTLLAEPSIMIGSEDSKIDRKEIIWIELLFLIRVGEGSRDYI